MELWLGMGWELGIEWDGVTQGPSGHHVGLK